MASELMALIDRNTILVLDRVMLRRSFRH
jgi:hypothetical protein